jgi:hypothetical protein
MDTTELKILYIVLGMILAFTGIFILLSFIPGERFNWMFE